MESHTAVAESKALADIEPQFFQTVRPRLLLQNPRAYSALSSVIADATVGAVSWKENF